MSNSKEDTSATILGLLNGKCKKPVEKKNEENDDTIEGERTPLNTNKYELFAFWLRVHASMFNIMDDPTVSTYLDLLNESLLRASNTKSVPMAERKIGNKSCKEFIAVFKEKFQLKYGTEYISAFSPADIKIIDILCRKLKDNLITTQEFLDWIFGKFIEENPKFSPVGVKLVCGGWVLQKILFEKKADIDSRRKKIKESLELQELSTSAKIIYRKHNDKKGLEAIKNFSSNSINIAELRNIIEELQQKYKDAP